MRVVGQIALTSEDRALLRQHLVQFVDSTLVENTAAKVEQYLELLSEWNQRGNLLSKNDLTRVVTRHVVESLACVPVLIALGGVRLVDVGSGGGFPGVLIKLARPSIDVTLVESRRMKSLFLEQVIAKLGLSGIRVVQTRAEEFPSAVRPSSESPGAFDLATARAVAAIPELAAWVAPLLRSGGSLLTFKGSRLEDELLQWTPGPEWESVRIVDSGIAHLRFAILRRS